MKWDEMDKQDMGDIKGGVSSKEAYGKPYDSWRLWGENKLFEILYIWILPNQHGILFTEFIYWDRVV